MSEPSKDEVNDAKRNVEDALQAYAQIVGDDGEIVTAWVVQMRTSKLDDLSSNSYRRVNPLHQPFDVTLGMADYLYTRCRHS